MWDTGRVLSFASASEATAQLPADSAALRGVLAAFSNDVRPQRVMLGRREAGAVTLTPDAVTTPGQDFTVTVTDTAGVATTATFTSITGAETAADIVTDLIADLGTPAGVTVSGTTELILSKATSDDFKIAGLEGLTAAFTTTETAATVLAALEDTDNTFYAVAASDHSQTFIDEMSAAIQSRKKIYVYSVMDANELVGWNGTDAPNSTTSLVASKGNSRTCLLYTSPSPRDGLLSRMPSSA